ncbi:hypothetical protein F7D14_14195 [Methylocystis parvus]|uniref:Pilus formation protein N-terminal domain-containing protein n=1 Tax=Methylocystis parvus TaxID=134 RepID=A0A6B8M6I2_9HYPH|nr:hypothetical protein F7D14_14195 [Methylocystis parvus]
MTAKGSSSPAVAREKSNSPLNADISGTLNPRWLKFESNIFYQSFTISCFIPLKRRCETFHMILKSGGESDHAAISRADADCPTPSRVGAKRQRFMVSRMTFVTTLFRGALLLAFGVAGLQATVREASANERAIRVDIDYARIVKIPQGASTLVIGNPLIADVTMLKNSQLMVITGKSFGTTNLIVLDKSGAQVGESTVTVVPVLDKVVVQRGMHRESLSCAPNCAKTVDLADDVAYMNSVIEAVKSHDSAATSSRR